MGNRRSRPVDPRADLCEITLESLVPPHKIDEYLPSERDADETVLWNEVHLGKNIPIVDPIQDKVFERAEATEVGLGPGAIDFIESAASEKLVGREKPIPRISDERELEVTLKLAASEDQLIKADVRVPPAGGPEQSGRNRDTCRLGDVNEDASVFVIRTDFSVSELLKTPETVSSAQSDAPSAEVVRQDVEHATRD